MPLKKRLFGFAVISNLLATALGLIVVSLATGSTEQTLNPSRLSSEYNFFNTSPLGRNGGLAVPASCPSDAHDFATWSWLGEPCTSSANMCGQTNTGTYQCGGSCSVGAPADSACPCTAEYYANFECNSPFNNCGEYNRGRVNCDNSCSIAPPADRVPCVACTPDNSCAASTCTGQTCTNNCGESVAGTLPPDNSCAISTCFNSSCTNSCGQSVPGTYLGTNDWQCEPCANWRAGAIGGDICAFVNSCNGAFSGVDESGCIYAVCGNGSQEPGEECDAGPGNGSCPAPCSSACTNNVCALCPNGAVDPGETCFSCPSDVPSHPATGTPCDSAPNICSMTDVGNTLCDGSCDASPPSDALCPVCGNGSQEPGEECDAGPGNGSCPAPCSSFCTLNSCAVCGNGSQEPGEECDAGPGNGSCPAPCSSACTNSACALCPNGAVDPGETCFSCPSDVPSHPATGTPCDSAPNICSMTNNGSTLCDGNCDATSPEDSLCPSPPICGDNNPEAPEECDTGVSRGPCPATCSNSCTTNVCGPGITNGVCGGAQGGLYAFAPSSGLCDDGSPSSVSSGGGLWSWTCFGSGGGSDDSCWAIVDTPIVCGDGIREGAEVCDNGGANGPCPASCSISCTNNGVCPGPVNGVCSTVHYLCNAGTSINNVDGATDWTWTCQGANGGSNANCSESKVVGGPPQCDLTHYNCVNGTSSGGFDAGASWIWWCTEPGYADAMCSELKVATTGFITSATPNPCNITAGNASCGVNISWTTSGAINPALQIPGAIPASRFGASGINQPFILPYGTHTATLSDLAIPTDLDTEVVSAQCIVGTAWNPGTGRCEAAPTVNLLINGSNGPIAATLGDSLTMSWSTTGTDATTTCTASGLWTGSKNRLGDSELLTAGASGTYTLSCTKPPLAAVSDSVTVNLSCTANCTSWSACGPPCSGGNGTQSRTCTTATCVVTNQNRSCTTDTCRDLNWKEVGQ